MIAAAPSPLGIVIAVVFLVAMVGLPPVAAKTAKIGELESKLREKNKDFRAAKKEIVKKLVADMAIPDDDVWIVEEETT